MVKLFVYEAKMLKLILKTFWGLLYAQKLLW